MFDAGYAKQKEELDRMNDKYRSQGGGRGWYYWMYVIRDGRPTVLGYKLTEQESRDYLYQYAPNENGQVICLDTRDLSSAVRKIKSKILETSHSLDEATVRMVRSQFKTNKTKEPKKHKDDEDDGWKSNNSAEEWKEFI